MNKNNTGKKQSAIIVASEGDHVDIMKLLLHHDQTFVNQKNAIGQSALSVALKKCSNRPYRQNPFRIVKLLLRCPKAEIKTAQNVDTVANHSFLHADPSRLAAAKISLAASACLQSAC